MPDFKALIEHHEKQSNQLHAALFKAFKRKDISDHAYKDWQNAAKACRDFGTEIDDLVIQTQNPDTIITPLLRDFIFSYFEVDPFYFRSGYMMERMVRRAKKLALTEAEKQIIQTLLLKRIDTKALRNFRDICRLIPMIETEGFCNEINKRRSFDDQSVRHRAEFAISYCNT